MAQAPAANASGSEPAVSDEETRRAVAFLPSHRKDCLAVARMSFDEYLSLDYEFGLAEWVDGEVRLYVSASEIHQRVIGFLLTLLSAYCDVTKAGRVWPAGYAMRAATGGSGREPDLLFVAREHLDRVQDSHLAGPPDLVVEVVSRDSARRDRREKFDEYQADGIPEYWLIDPRPGHQTAELFALRSGRYRRVPPSPDGILRSTVVAGFWIRTSWLWDDDPAIFDAVVQVVGLDARGFISETPDE